MKTYMDFLAEAGIESAHPGGFFLTKEILCKLNIQRTTHILDVGCGTGQTAAYIAQKYKANVAAIDNHHLMVKKAKQRFSWLQLPIRLLHCSVESLPFPNEQFDIVMCESVLSFVNLNTALKEIHRVLKKNGVLIAIEATKNRTLEKKDTEIISSFYGFKIMLTEKEWITKFKNENFRVIKTFLPTKTASFYQQGAVQYGSELPITPQISDKHLLILQKHENLTKKYQKELGFRVYFCKK
jgi:ubiquinone/menaquinone biosynthesis C-methylase UbiE